MTPAAAPEAIKLSLNPWVAAFFSMPCVVCGVGDQPCCAACWPRFEPTISDLAGLPKISAAEYGSLSQFILPFKEHSLMAMARVLAPLAMQALQAIDSQLRAAGSASSEQPVTVVYPPSSRANFRKRGFNPAERILRLAANPSRFRVTEAFKWSRGVADQGSLSKRSRLENLTDSLIATKSKMSQVLIFDDVSATGSTLREMRRALEKNDNRVIGYCVLAESFLNLTPATAG